MFDRLKQWARSIKRDVIAVYFAARHPETPLLARCLAMFIAAYALSPIDLIPDFIPVLGYLDDIIIVPLGLLLVIRMLPKHVLDESRERAAAVLAKPKSMIAAVVIAGVWVVAMTVVGYVVFVRWVS
jgi:uncharacterized membrane protein YkvA (DUF1232 family)